MGGIGSGLKGVGGVLNKVNPFQEGGLGTKMSIALLAGALFADRLLKDGELQLHRVAALAMISAIAFNWIVSSSILLKTDVSMLAPYLLNGLLYDLYHAVGNLVFVAWLAAPLGEIMLRHRVKPSAEAVSEVVSN